MTYKWKQNINLCPKEKECVMSNETPILLIYHQFASEVIFLNN